MRIIYLIIGFLSLALAIVGGRLALVADNAFSFCCLLLVFLNLLNDLKNWLYHTKLYQTYVADFRETKSIARERKKKIIVSIYILMGISIYLPLFFL